eukprot:scaffold14297_cov113-Skeletonema_dohrnii-CCMP3373.AAC.2
MDSHQITSTGKTQKDDAPSCSRSLFGQLYCLLLVDGRVNMGDDKPFKITHNADDTVYPYYY